MKLSLEQKIAAAEQRKQDAEKEVNDLKAKYNEREEKAKNDRIFKRGNLWEDLMPDIAKLTHTQFRTFLDNTVLNQYGQRELAKLLAQNAHPTVPQNGTAAAPKPADTSARTDTPPAAKPTQAAQSGVTGGNGNATNNTQQTS